MSTRDLQVIASSGELTEIKLGGTTAGDKLLTSDEIATLIPSTASVKMTTEGGIAILLTNKTGVASVKGTLVSASTLTDDAFMLQSNEFDTIGVVYDNDCADGETCWVVVAGIAQVLLKDGTAATRGYWVIAADTDGRADATQTVPLPNNTLNEHTTHFKEVGHCLESKLSGTNVLAKVVLHFN